MDRHKLQEKARRHINDASTTQQSPESLDSIHFNEFKTLSFPQLVEILGIKYYQKKTHHAHEDIVILKTYLAKAKLGDDDSSTEAAIIAVRRFVVRVILPTSEFALKSPYAINDPPTLSANEVASFHRMSSDGLTLLSQLNSLLPFSPPVAIATAAAVGAEQEKDQVLYLQSISSFADPTDTWTCSRSNNIAIRLLDAFKLSRGQKSKDLAQSFSSLLRECVKPAFASGGRRNPAITPQGRKAIDLVPSVVDDVSAAGEFDQTTIPWKYGNVYIVTVLGWIIGSLGSVEDSFIRTDWSLLVPPVLTLTDDLSITYKAKGCLFLSQILQRVPPAFLDQTGLGDIFESTLVSNLSYLPPLTEEADSVKLLGETYPALIHLAHVRHPQARDRALMQKALDRIMQEGILKGYAQAIEHVRVADFLVKQLGQLVNEMGIDVVKHLKYISPLLSDNLAAPFALAYFPLLFSTLDTLQMMILVAWPRISYHRGEILRGLTVCWGRIEEHDGNSEELDKLRRCIQSTMSMLTATLEREVDVSDEYSRIIESDERLRTLLPV